MVTFSWRPVGLGENVLIMFVTHDCSALRKHWVKREGEYQDLGYSTSSEVARVPGSGGEFSCKINELLFSTFFEDTRKMFDD